MVSRSLRILTFILAVLPPCAFAAESPLSERDLNGYSLRIYRHGDYFADQYLEVRRGDSLLFRVSGALTVMDSGAAKLGNDLTGNGQPDAVIESYSGGAHCCFTYYFLQLGKAFALLDSLPAEDSGARFENGERRGRVNVITGDNTFAYWNAPFAASPAPEVILTFQDGHLHVADSLMRKMAPSPDSLRNWAASVQGDSLWGPYTGESGPSAQVPAELWRVMLDLIYGGHADMAWTFFDRAWPRNIPGKERFHGDFRQQLGKSRYYAGILRLNDGTLEPQR